MSCLLLIKMCLYLGQGDPEPHDSFELCFNCLFTVTMNTKFCSAPGTVIQNKNPVLLRVLWPPLNPVVSLVRHKLGNLILWRSFLLNETCYSTCHMLLCFSFPFMERWRAGKHMFRVTLVYFSKRNVYIMVMYCISV